MLFNIVINVTTDQIEKCKVLLYADDIVIFTSDKDSKTIDKILNTEFNNIAKWFTINNLFLNLKKKK